jgi:hypothetical protein
MPISKKRKTKGGKPVRYTSPAPSGGRPLWEALVAEARGVPVAA